MFSFSNLVEECRLLFLIRCLLPPLVLHSVLQLVQQHSDVVVEVFDRFLALIKRICELLHFLFQFLPLLLLLLQLSYHLLVLLL